ncbi:MAG: hypothetical protein QHH75_04495 [Bacillota bacterium]|nr:hypothetical protein [Bacillota bacterium]
MFNRCYCQELEPADWHEKEHFWEEPRFFYRVPTPMALHNPLTYNEDISRAMIEAKGKGYIVKPRASILLKSGLFRGEILLEVQLPQQLRSRHQTGPPPASCHRLEGAFYTIISRAPLSQMGAVIEQFLRDLKKKGEKVQDLYLCLGSCPLCSSKKGNQTVIIARLHERKFSKN